jgi:hypothetical protein
MTLKKQSFRFTRRSVPLLTGIGLLAVGWTMTMHARAQVVMNGPVLYAGEPSATSGVKLSSWGSGAITEDNKGVFGTGTMSLRIVSHGLYQGASLQLPKAVDLGSYAGNKFAYLSIVVVPPAPPVPANGANSPYGASGRGGKAPGTSGGPSFGAEEGGGGQSGAPGSSGFGGRGESGGLNSKPLTVKYQTPHAMQNIRVVLVTTTGRRFDMLLPLDSAVDDGPWKRVSVPISVIPGINADDAKIKDVHLFGDSPGIMRVGNIGVIVDQTPIMVDSLPNRDLARLATHEFRVVARGGITPLLISWDWDATDGIQDESQGKFVTHQFRKESGYDRDSNKILDNVVTVTVRDLYGIKKPVSTKFSVHVTP